MSHPTLVAINFECSNPPALAAFWAALLGGDVVLETPAYCAVKVGGLHIGAAQVDGYEAPTWPAQQRSQQLHLDLAVEDLDEAVTSAIDLGATVEQYQPSPAGSRVLRDPAGHPFCFRTPV